MTSTSSIKRTQCVSVRLNTVEAALLDQRRKRSQRGRYLRALLLDRTPPVIPTINLDMHRDLGRALGNLATIATAMRAGNYAELNDVLGAVRALRTSLICGTVTPGSEAPVSPDGVD